VNGAPGGGGSTERVKFTFWNAEIATRKGFGNLASDGSRKLATSCNWLLAPCTLRSRDSPRTAGSR
jgi:hypothetical protein